jgi:hypothetical protein
MPIVSPARGSAPSDEPVRAHGGSHGEGGRIEPAVVGDRKRGRDCSRSTKHELHQETRLDGKASIGGTRQRGWHRAVARLISLDGARGSERVTRCASEPSSR